MWNVQHHTRISADPAQKRVDPVDDNFFQETRVFSGLDDVVAQDVHNAGLSARIQKGHFVLRLVTGAALRNGVVDARLRVLGGVVGVLSDGGLRLISGHESMQPEYSLQLQPVGSVEVIRGCGHGRHAPLLVWSPARGHGHPVRLLLQLQEPS